MYSSFTYNLDSFLLYIALVLDGVHLLLGSVWVLYLLFFVVVVVHVLVEHVDLVVLNVVPDNRRKSIRNGQE